MNPAAFQLLIKHEYSAWWSLKGSWSVTSQQRRITNTWRLTETCTEGVIDVSGQCLWENMKILFILTHTCTSHLHTTASGLTAVLSQIFKIKAATASCGCLCITDRNLNQTDSQAGSDWVSLCLVSGGSVMDKKWKPLWFWTLCLSWDVTEV